MVGMLTAEIVGSRMLGLTWMQTFGVVLIVGAFVYLFGDLETAIEKAADRIVAAIRESQAK